MKLAVNIVVVGAFILLAAGEVSAHGWYLKANAALGRANQELENPLGTFGFESISVPSVAAGGGYLFANNVSATIELGWSKRGGAFTTATTVFRPEGEEFEQDRTYLDITSSWSYRLLAGNTTVGISLSPRASIMVTEPEVGFSPLRRKVVPGVDPSIFVGYKGVQVIGRYVFDLGPAYRSSGEGLATVDDTAFFVGLGIEFAL